MCVILVCPPKVRPELEILKACHTANPHGAGVGWRENDKVHWQKNLEPQEVDALIRRLEGEIIIHFRWASVGGVNPRLCHPFPVNREASTKLAGSTQRLLFHNGTWSGHKEAVKFVEKKQKRIVHGAMSDTRAIALLIDYLRDKSVLRNIEGRFVLFSVSFTKLYGAWQQWGGMCVSNLGFLYEMERRERRERWESHDDRGKREQMALWKEVP